MALENMEKKQKKKKKKKLKRSSGGSDGDPYSVFDPGRIDGRGRPRNRKEREAQIRQDKLKLAQRYEAIRLFDESIKYYRQIEMFDEADRVLQKKIELYSAKAKEFESEGRYAEAAELYERIDEREKAGEMRRKGGIPDVQMFSLDLKYSDAGFEADHGPPAPSTVRLESTRNIRWEMPNVDVDTLGKTESARRDTVVPDRNKVSVDGSVKKDAGKVVGEPIPIETSQDIVRSAEDDSRPDHRPGSPAAEQQTGTAGKRFSICPYCGEELNLPKQPRFCPYCREPLA